MVLSWLPKLFLGSALLAGTGIGLGSAIFASSGNENVELTSKKESLSEEAKLEEGDYVDESVADEKKTKSDAESLEKDVDLKGGGDVDKNHEGEEPLDSDLSRQSDDPSVSDSKIVEKTGCILHQLLSSKTKPWTFRKVGSGDEFLKGKSKTKAYGRIKSACDSAKGADILLTNKSQSWWGGNFEWDYDLKNQQEPEFKNYLRGVSN